MAAPNQFGTNKQMEPITDAQSNGANKPLTQRFSRSHKITTRRHPDAEAAPSNAPVPPTAPKPPFSNGFQHYQPVGTAYPTYSRPETGVADNQQTWPSVWNPLPKYPVLEQHLNFNNRSQMAENWNNSVQNYDRIPPDYIHEQNTVQYSPSGALSFQHSLRQNYMMATQTLRTFVNRNQESNKGPPDKSPVFEFRESSFSMPPLQPIASLRSEDLKRMAEMSKLMNGGENVRNGPPESELEKQLRAPNRNDSDSDDLVIVEKPAVKCESPITISSDESGDEKMETSVTEPIPDDSLSDNLDAPTHFSSNETLEQSESVSSLGTSDEAKNEVVSSNDTESQADGEMTNSFITLRYCTVRMNADDIRELVKTASNEDIFSVRKLRNDLLEEKTIAPCFKKKTKPVTAVGEETVTAGSKRKSNGPEVSKPRKFCNIFSMSNLLSKPSPRKYTDAVICGKCKCRVSDIDEHAAPNCCDLTDIYPCLDAKCEKTFICFQRYQAHVEAHGYKVREPRSPQVDAEQELETPSNYKEKCVFCDDIFSHSDSLTLHLKQIHRVNNDSEFLEDFDAKSLFAGIKDWLSGLSDEDPQTCKLCSNALPPSEMRNHIVDYHSAEKNTNLVRTVKVKPKKKLNVEKFIVPASEDNGVNEVNETSLAPTVIVRKIKMSAPDATRDKPPPPMKDVERWLRGLEDSADGTGIICLFCEKMFLSVFAVYKHLKTSHGTCLDKIFGSNLLSELAEVEKCYSVKDGLAFCSSMCEMDRVAEKIKVLLMHFVDPETRKAFGFDSHPVGEILVKLLYSMDYSYCLFGEDGDKDEAFDALRRNVRTFLVACVAPEVRNIVGFDTASVEQVLDNLFEYIGVV